MSRKVLNPLAGLKYGHRFSVKRDSRSSGGSNGALGDSSCASAMERLRSSVFETVAVRDIPARIVRRLRQFDVLYRINRASYLPLGGIVPT
jgi:hypothetical protein